MSHFNVLVLTKDGSEEQAETLLAPFDEGREVPQYEKPCWCIGSKAKLRVYNKLIAETPIDRARAEFASRPDVQKLISESKEAGNYGFSKEADALWEEVFVKPFEARHAALLPEEPDINAPDPDCVYCAGSGVEISTYNPLSKWDSYELGGHWSTLFAPVQGASVAEFLDFAKKHTVESPFLTFAVLTPDGEWYEKGIVLYDGVVKDAKSNEEWESLYTEVLQKFPEYRVLIYDCHI